MNTFTSIKELLQTLVRERELLTEMFEKRTSMAYKYEYAIEMVEHVESRITYLTERSVLRLNGNFLEIDELFLEFFEQVLDVNEEINTASINTNIQNVRDNILYYLKENNEIRKYNYLRKVKGSLRKIGIITLRNVVDLKRNIDNTFKNEPNYKIKKAKLENLDRKRTDITTLIEQTYLLIDEEEQTFFRSVYDDELRLIITLIKSQLIESRHNLIEIQKQIIEYLNQIRYQSGVIEKLRQLKYLKDQFTINETTDIRPVLSQNCDVVFEKNPSYPLKLSLDYLQSDNVAHDIIKKVAGKIKTSSNFNISLAGLIDPDYLESNEERVNSINLDEVRNNFLARGNNLFDFVLDYDFEREITFDEKVTVYCQLISMYESQFTLTGDYNTRHGIEFAMVYPK